MSHGARFGHRRRSRGPRRWARLAVLVAVVVGSLGLVMPAYGGGVIPPIPPLPAPPAPLTPVIQLITPAGDASVGVVCGVAGPTNLLLFVLPGLPATAAKLGLPPIAVPGFDLPAELTTAAGDIVSLQDSVCAYIPPEAEHTVCRPDDQLASAATLPPSVSALLGKLTSDLVTSQTVPPLSPPIGTFIDTLKELQARGLSAVAPLIATLTKTFQCHLRSTSVTGTGGNGGGLTSGPSGTQPPHPEHSRRPILGSQSSGPATTGTATPPLTSGSAGRAYGRTQGGGTSPLVAAPSGASPVSADIARHGMLAFIAVLLLLLYRAFGPRSALPIGTVLRRRGQPASE